MKLGILGTGKIVLDLMNTYKSLGIEKTYLLSTKRSELKAKELTETYNLDGVFTDYDELLNTDIDTVYVALPNSLHYAYALKAIRAHKHVICEKPMTSNLEEFESLKEEAEDHHVYLFEAVTIHAMPAYLELKEQIDQLGKIKIVSLNYSQYSSRYDAFKEGNILPVFNVHLSGGALYDLNVYNIHFIAGLFGRPKSVQYMANIEHDIDTSGIVTLDYGSFKAVLVGAKDCQAPLMNTIQGDEGYITVDTPVNRMTHYAIARNNEEPVTHDLNEGKHAMSYEFKEFIRIIDEHDKEKATQLLCTSEIACEILTKARQSAGIVFDADQK